MRITQILLFCLVAVSSVADGETNRTLPYHGRYPAGSLVHNDIWYYGTYSLGPEGSTPHNGFTWNWPNLGPMPGFQISRDFGKTWEPSPHTPEKPLFPEPRKFLGPVKMGAPHFVDFGKNLCLHEVKWLKRAAPAPDTGPVIISILR